MLFAGIDKVFSLKKKQNIRENEKILEKVMEFCQSGKVGAMKMSMELVTIVHYSVNNLQNTIFSDFSTQWFR